MVETNSLNQMLVEKENDKMKNQLKVVIEEIGNHLEFPPVLQGGYDENNQYEEERYFRKSNGAVLRGRLVFYLEEYYDQTMDGDMEFCMEVFLTDEGNLLKFYTFRESHNCQDCLQTHTHLHRMVAKDQTLSEDYLISILNNISVDLKLAS